jgi:DNA repair exonuclease SbcCD ATPase subunit
VRYNERAYGLRASLGPVDLHLGDPALEAQYDRSDMVACESMDGLRARIDSIEDLRHTEAEIAIVKAAAAETASRLQELVDRTHAGLHDVAAGLRQTEAEIAAVKVADAETVSRLQEVADRMQAGLHNVAATVEELQAQVADKMVLQTATQGALEALRAEATGKMQTVQAQVERFQVEAQNAVDEIHRAVDRSHGQAAAEAQAFRESFERANAELQEALGKMQTLAAQIAQSQAPPAAGSAPQLLEFYGGFQLIRYGSRIYGLRRSLGEVDLLLGEILLEARYGGEDLVIGDSTDGVKARIDALEAERAVQKLSERLQSLESSIVKS